MAYKALPVPYELPGSGYRLKLGRFSLFEWIFFVKNRFRNICIYQQRGSYNHIRYSLCRASVSF
jgi:hypothetical protein